MLVLLAARYCDARAPRGRAQDEESFLRQLGWTEDADDNAPLTVEEMQEIQTLAVTSTLVRSGSSKARCCVRMGRCAATLSAIATVARAQAISAAAGGRPLAPTGGQEQGRGDASDTGSSASRQASSPLTLLGYLPPADSRRHGSGGAAVSRSGHDLAAADVSDSSSDE